MSVAAVPAQVDPATPAVEEETTDNFAAAFEQLAKLGEKPVTDEAMDGKPPVAAPAAPEKTIDEVIAEPAPAAGADDLPDPEAQIAENEARAAAEKEKTPAAVKSAADDVLERLVERLGEKKPAAQEREVVTPPEPDYTKEEADFVANYIKEFPDVARAETLIRRTELRQVVNYVFAEVTKALTPLQQTVGQLSTRTHLSDIESEVEDYADVREKVIAWIGEQPSYLQDAYNRVVKEGTTDQVVDLISRYRTATGAPAPAAQTPTNVHKDTELPPGAKKAATALAPVSSKRSTVVSAPSKEDFDAAFKEAAAVTET